MSLTTFLRLIGRATRSPPAASTGRSGRPTRTSSTSGTSSRPPRSARPCTPAGRRSRRRPKVGMAVYLNPADPAVRAGLARPRPDERRRRPPRPVRPGVGDRRPQAQRHPGRRPPVRPRRRRHLPGGGRRPRPPAPTTCPADAPGKLVRQKPPVSVAVLRRTAGRPGVRDAAVRGLPRPAHPLPVRPGVRAGRRRQPAGARRAARHHRTQPLAAGLAAGRPPVFEGKAPPGPCSGTTCPPTRAEERVAAGPAVQRRRWSGTRP
jgi:hypothetical protein